MTSTTTEKHPKKKERPPYAPANLSDVARTLPHTYGYSRSWVVEQAALIAAAQPPCLKHGDSEQNAIHAMRTLDTILGIASHCDLSFTPAQRSPLL